MLSYEVNSRPYFIEASRYYGKENKGFTLHNNQPLFVTPNSPEGIIPMKTIDGLFLFMGISCIILGMFGFILISFVEHLM